MCSGMGLGPSTAGLDFDSLEGASFYGGGSTFGGMQQRPPSGQPAGPDPFAALSELSSERTMRSGMGSMNLNSKGFL